MAFTDAFFGHPILLGSGIALLPTTTTHTQQKNKIAI